MIKSLQIESFGQPNEVVSLLKTQNTPLMTGQVRITISASPINPADINYIQGTYGVRPELPTQLGLEASGIVSESNSSDIKVGTQVIFLKRVGTWANEVVCEADAVLAIEGQIDHLQLSMLKVNPMTAWRLLTAYTELKQGDYIIQNAANSGVGQCVIQIAKLLGFKTINLVRRESLIEPLKALGADIVLLDNSGYKDQLLEILDSTKLPQIGFNAVGGDSALRLMDALAEKGTHVTYGAMSMRSLKVPNKFLIFKRINLQGLWVTKDIAELPKQYIHDSYRQLAAWLADGSLTQRVDKTYPLSQYAAALDHHLNQEKNGKILFQPTQ